MTEEKPNQYVLVISCPDTTGIVAAVACFLADHDAFILESAHFGDSVSKRFFMRTVFIAGAFTPEAGELAKKFSRIAERFQMVWGIYDAYRRQRLMILVSKFDHCLNDLLYRYRTGDLAVEIPAIVSNHPDLKRLADWHEVPFHHLPVTAENKSEQEDAIWRLIVDLDIDLVVLARYMQVLSPRLCDKLRGRSINIHHSFLPSFKGAKPYHQAHKRGVKLIGATAHYVTTDLDEGPIIEQEVERVDHTLTPEALVAVGRDIENVVLARAVRFHVEHRVLLNGSKTVVFR
ncbi:MAG: formyltetrahydrofolate deformylase [Rhodospirillales bacterium]|nr:formyltetrahydrofolate deformylase [Rhodospirillales bacterium]MCW8861618.1 formyltetrahydrofolate deformylase [Rhodospirillales bacterium]MCW8951505.1 formyltetrahydrofolate deformylase [Rhodospirillales bacterium]MCW8970594.1 formyltetrahydrofolate deformylase [Rhodospirillales bacterium]MCW9001286.1 formyltetrahydrofolate deformylase [Rhodospirillales bacterium]